jgi:hypothetical protein
MLSVTDNSRGRAVIPRYIVCSRQIARLTTKYSVFSRHELAFGVSKQSICRSIAFLIPEQFGSRAIGPVEETGNRE